MKISSHPYNIIVLILYASMIQSQIVVEHLIKYLSVTDR